MKQLTVALSSDADADVLFEQINNGLRGSAYKINMTRNSPQIIELRFNESDPMNDGNSLCLATELTRLIAVFIVNRLELFLLRKMLLKHYHYDELELNEMMQYCKQLLIDTEVCLNSVEQGRVMWIRNQLSVYIQLNSFIDVDGFVQFRLKKYLNDLQEIVDDARNEFLMNEQYQEFIALLKYFVYFQDAKIPEVHLIHQGNNKFQLLDENLQQLDISESRDVIVETIDRELNYEDMVVSALISASPKQIHIHTRDPESQSIKTIQQIFEGRTIICTCCKLCKPYLGDWQAERLT